MRKILLNSLTLIVLVSICGLMFIGCSKNKDIVIGDGKKEEENTKSQYIKITEKKVPIPSGYRPILWKSDTEIVLANDEGEIYSFNQENNEMKNIKINGDIVDQIVMSSRVGVSKDGDILCAKDLKLFIYSLNENTREDIIDLKDIKKDVEIKYSIENDKNIVRHIKIGFVNGDRNKIYIITHGQYDGYHKNKVRIIDRYTKEVITSDEYIDCNLVDVLSYNGKYYVTSLFNKLYEADIQGNTMKLNIITKSIESANSRVYITREGRVIQGRVVRENNGDFKFYNLLEKKDEKTFYFQDREKLSSVVVANYNIENNIIVFTKSYKKKSEESGEEDKDFVGVVKGNTIGTIYKISDYEKKDKTRSWTSAVFNEKGNKAIIKRWIYNTEDAEDSRCEYIVLDIN